MTIRVVIADDHEMFRNGLRALLATEDDLEIVGEASSGQETFEILREKDAEILILDLSMPGGMSGAQTAEAALEIQPNIAIVVVTMHEDEYYLREMLRIGARGFLLKKSSVQDLVQGLRTVYQGGVFIDPSLTHHMVASFVGIPEPKKTKTSRLSLLTKREQEVCQVLALGYTNAEVGKNLFISERTVETHRANIMAKLQLRNRADLVRFSLENGLLPGTSRKDRVKES